MKRALLVLSAVFITSTFTILIVAVTLSFKVVRQNTDKINQSLKDQMQQIVRIPGVIPPETKLFNSTVYVWEMETNQGEITKVKFTHDTLFDKNTDNFTATLEMENNEDPSLFNKVLPAVIADEQAYYSSQNIQKPRLESNESIGYEKISLYEVEGRAGQVSKISWLFPKDKVIPPNQELYQKIHAYPPSILKALYALQRFIITAFSS